MNTSPQQGCPISARQPRHRQMDLLPMVMLHHICDQLDSVSFSRLRACSRLLHGAQQSVENQSITARIVKFRKLYKNIRCLWALMDPSSKGSSEGRPSGIFPGSGDITDLGRRKPNKTLEMLTSSAESFFGLDVNDKLHDPAS